MKKLTDVYVLNNGVKIPCIGFGTWQSPEGDATVNAVKWALEDGYRHIDTARVYKNERSVGQAIKESGIPREEIFLTTKVWNADRGYEQTLEAFDKSLERLGTDYLDLYLIHWPAIESQFENYKELNTETYRAMEKLYEDGKVKAIGVCNFKKHHLEELLKTAKVVPAINQIEFHPGFMQDETVKYCQEKGILVEAWSPLGSGRVLNDERLKEIADKYNKSVAQLCIKWVLQHGHLPLPKSVTEERILDNTKVFDFEISKEDMEKIDSLEEFGFSGMNPDTVTF